VEASTRWVDPIHWIFVKGWLRRLRRVAYRGANQVMIDTELLTEMAGDAIVAVDPYRKGFDVFKSELIAAEKAAVVPQDQAAE
jgi:hypothetical protein